MDAYSLASLSVLTRIKTQFSLMLRNTVVVSLAPGILLWPSIILCINSDVETDEQRLVGLVMIPGKHMLNIDIEDLDASNEYM